MTERDQAEKRQTEEPEYGEALLIREWDSDEFHRKVAELEARGYQFEEDSYRIVPEMNPENGEITHLHCIEMRRSATANDVS